MTIYYGEDGNGYLLASSQGDNTFSIYDRAGSNSYLGKFAIDNVEESDGVDVINVPLGDKFPAGLLVVQDGNSEPAVVFRDTEDGEIQNFNTNFKYVSLADFADVFPELPPANPNAFDPRNSQPNTLINGVASGDTTQDSTVLWARSIALGDITIEYSTDAEFQTIIETIPAEVTNINIPIKIAIDGLTAGTDYYYRVTDAAGDVEIGEFTTSNEIGTYNGFRFGVTGDWQQAPPYPSLSNADERDLELFVKLGDTIFADSETPALLGVSQARNLSDFRTKHVEAYDKDRELMVIWGCVWEYNESNKNRRRKFNTGSFWALKKEIFASFRFDESMRYFGTTACDEHELARRLKKQGYKFSPLETAQAKHFHAPADNRKRRGIGGDLNYLYENTKTGSILEYYLTLIKSFLMAFIFILTRKKKNININSKYKQLILTPGRIVSSLKERRLDIAVKWLYYVSIDIPFRAKRQVIRENIYRKYGLKY